MKRISKFSRLVWGILPAVEARLRRGAIEENESDVHCS
jgi:hypothetical protein